MILESHDRLNHPERKKATRLVVYDDFGNAVLTALQIDSRNLDIRVRGQPGFEEALRYLGIKQTVICDTIKAKDLPKLSLDG